MFDTRSSGVGILCGIQSQQHFGCSLHLAFFATRYTISRCKILITHKWCAGFKHFIIITL